MSMHGVPRSEVVNKEAIKTRFRGTEWEQERCQDSHGKGSREVVTLATNTRPVSLGTMVQVSTWTSEPLVESASHLQRRCEFGARRPDP